MATLTLTTSPTGGSAYVTGVEPGPQRQSIMWNRTAAAPPEPQAPQVTVKTVAVVKAITTKEMKTTRDLAQKIREAFKLVVAKTIAFHEAEAYIAELALADGGAAVITPSVAAQAQQILRSIRSENRLLPVPTIGVDGDGVLGMTWDGAGHHVNVQIFPDGHLEFFHENIATGELWSDEAAKEVTGDLMGRLARVLG